MSVKLINPTKSEVRTEILGRQYVIEAGGSIENVPEADAEYWVTKIHQFLIVDQGNVTAPNKEEVRAEEEAAKNAN